MRRANQEIFVPININSVTTMISLSTSVLFFNKTHLYKKKKLFTTYEASHCFEKQILRVTVKKLSL